MGKLLTFSNEVGLITATKAEIFEDLKNITIGAFGADFSLVEGTEFYLFLDSIANSLNDFSNAAVDLYNSLDFISAHGSTLDNIASMAGLVRKVGETDAQLRFRYQYTLYLAATSTKENIIALISSLSYVKGCSIVENTTSGNILINSATLPVYTAGKAVMQPHSIFVIAYIPKEEDRVNEEYRKELANIIYNYKSLGCALEGKEEVHIIEESTVNNIKFSFVAFAKCTFKVTMNWYTDNIEIQKTIHRYIRDFIKEYIDSLNPGEDVLFSGVMASAYKVYSVLDTEQRASFNIVSITMQKNGETPEAENNEPAARIDIFGDEIASTITNTEEEADDDIQFIDRQGI